MKIEYLFSIMSILLFTGLSGLASAALVSDTTGDALLAPYDINRAKVIVYPHTECSEDGSPCIHGGQCEGTCDVIDDIPEFMKVSLEMTDKLPGTVIVELDVDGNTATGGGGMHSLFPACQGGGSIKPAVPGLDISILIVLDDQDNDSMTAWCRDCTGTDGQCFYKNTYCSGCGTPDCYNAETLCGYLDTNCYLAGDQCSYDPGCESCFEMTQECSEGNPCAYGKVRGEWFASALDPLQMSEPFFSRGKIEMPLPPHGGPNGFESEMCITLPWRRIVNEMKYLAGSTFDANAAKDPTNLSWQLHVWEDGVVGGNDYINPTVPCLEVVDVIPDDGSISAKWGSHACIGDLNGDGQVSSMDIVLFKANWGRSWLSLPCPGSGSGFNDSLEDALIAGYDIATAKVAVYPHKECSEYGSPCIHDGHCYYGGTCDVIDDIPEFMKVSLEMNDKLPGVVIMDFDVDGNTTTGGGGIHFLPTCVGFGSIKPAVPGLDISILVVLDDQDNDSMTAWCRDCTGTDGLCFYKNTYCSGCGTPDCYKAETPCGYLDTNCYLAGNQCSYDPGCESCFEMTYECPVPGNRDYGKVRGEWFAIRLEPPQMSEPFFSRGRIEMPLPPQGGPNGIDSEMSITLPWRMIVEQMYTAGSTFDANAAKDPANLTWQLHVWEDGVAGGNDYINEYPFCLEVVDVIPDSGLLQGQAGTHACIGDLNNDGNSDAVDVSFFKHDYPRSPYQGVPCPTCY